MALSFKRSCLQFYRPSLHDLMSGAYGSCFGQLSYSYLLIK